MNSLVINFQFSFIKGLMGAMMTRASKGEMETYGKAGAIAEEVFSSIRSSSSHVFTIPEYTNLQFFFHEIFFVLFFLQGRSFLLRSKMPI